MTVRGQETLAQPPDLMTADPRTRRLTDRTLRSGCAITYGSQVPRGCRTEQLNLLVSRK